MRGPNKGPGGGGRYSNEHNHLESGGETLPTEAQSMTGTQISYMGGQVAAKRGVERAASEKEMRGGN